MSELMQGPTKAECEGNRDRCTLTTCPLFGGLGRPFRDGKQRVRGCGDPAARGKRSRAKGDRTGTKVRKALNIPGVNSRHEEVWGGALRVEVKSGAQCGPVLTRFGLSEAQSELQRPIGDHRPFLATFTNGTRTVGCFDLDKQVEIAVAILANHGLEVQNGPVVTLHRDQTA